MSRRHNETKPAVCRVGHGPVSNMNNDRRVDELSASVTNMHVGQQNVRRISSTQLYPFGAYGAIIENKPPLPQCIAVAPRSIGDALHSNYPSYGSAAVATAGLASGQPTPPSPVKMGGHTHSSGAVKLRQLDEPRADDVAAKKLHPPRKGTVFTNVCALMSHAL